ncbi:MAG: hypothetical protein GXO96_06535, partial [Nitrospirae bacterium]|nr:hypothetical protein [Candidatus Manganitrophaceae bacterium]
MTEQRHRIKRQILELSIPGQQATPAFYADVRRLYDQEIAPLIERCCSELSRPDQIHRIDRLELDLGSLDPNHFEADLVAKIAAQLRQKLSDCLELEKPQTTEIPQPPKATQPTDARQAVVKPAEQHQESSPVR